jgi:hypothetical protein
MQQLRNNSGTIIIILGFVSIQVILYGLLRLYSSWQSSQNNNNINMNQNQWSHVTPSQQLANTENRKYLFSGIVSQTCNNQEHRNIIRKWMSHYQSTVDYKFFMMSTCEKEVSPSESDVIFIEVRNKKYSAAEMVEKLIQYFDDNHSMKYRYLVKTNDLTLIRYDAMQRLLEQGVDHTFGENLSQQELAHKVYGYAGYFISNTRVYDKHYENKMGILQYVIYAESSGYALSAALARTLNTLSKTAEMDKFQYDDTTIGHWVSNVQHTRLAMEDMFLTANKDKRSCSKNLIVISPLRDAKLLDRVADSIIKDDWDEACVVLNSL